ncbi:MAG TPA: DNA phosphorothioation-associated putative methyltransferase [Pseudoalteromonas sp.]|uniref:DNA phosphorothioation-associated methyltransferase n=1 Tax=marine sediment metagenome TaxID=412755 RepID=A0A0F9S347_9ZZZZ|nr:DNA phosphorothioation-associated putative methyltransferase [Pseudoalteromonas sp.]HDY91003.1 DNA phosphorothioation-associated putative methyltransferase [Pseudoalteromonas sp.]HDZ32560.1 DNA phosphorothioation-associated putative methyltransferase [Pseudoalteromonas sp.]
MDSNLPSSLSFPKYRDLVKKLKHGKSLPTAIYLHKSSLEIALQPELLSFIQSTINQLNINEPWNLLKLYKRDLKFTLLNYPDFDNYAYPALNTSYTIDAAELTIKTTNYSNSDNPPILHRKETFILPSYNNYNAFKKITNEGEQIGLYQNTKSIGFKQQWQNLIKRKGYKLDEKGMLHKVAEVKQPKIEQKTEKIQRHLTAINRDRLSAPFQKLAKYGYLNGDYSILDYGCGLADDATELEAHGLNINAWDPVHRPNGCKQNSDIVNLGFVLNVIENVHERTETLKNAYQCTNQLLLVSVMLANEAKQEHFKQYKDGVITKWNTFQKYYSQAQIRAYIEQTLNVKTMAFGQGIIAIFKCPQLEEAHHLELQFQNYNWQHITQKAPLKALPKAQQKTLFEKHQTLLNDFWQHCLHFGRLPANDEFEQSTTLRKYFASHNKAFNLLQNYYEQNEFEQAQQKRKHDLLVYFALSLFGKRQAKSHMPARLTRDLKVHFSDYNQALEQAKQLLFSIAEPANIGNACYQAYEQIQLGELHDNHSYILPTRFLNQLPAILRVYIGCAVQLYGDIDDVDLVKIHMRSGKVTFLKYDDFNKKLPLLTERIKVKMLEQDIDYFFYGSDYPLQPLYNKLDYLLKSSNEYKSQQRFDKKLTDMLKGVPKKEWPNWLILQKVFEYWAVELKGNKFFKK